MRICRAGTQKPHTAAACSIDSRAEKCYNAPGHGRFPLHPHGGNTRQQLRSFPPSPRLQRVLRTGESERAPAADGGSRQAARRCAGPHPAERAAGAGQDHAGQHHRQRRRTQAAHHLRPPDREGGGLGGHPDQRGTRGHPLHRRDPPPAPRHRGVPLPRYGGFSAGHHHRPRPRRAVHSAEPTQVYPGGRHHASRDAHGTPALPLRVNQPAGLLLCGGFVPHPAPLRRPAEHRADGRGGHGHRAALPRHTPRGQCPAALGARLCPGEGRRPHHG